MKLTAKEFAGQLYKNWIYYWGNEGLKTKQMITHSVMSGIKPALEGMGLEYDSQYWSDVRKQIYDMPGE
jgi:hypothetical protein